MCTPKLPNLPTSFETSRLIIRRLEIEDTPILHEAILDCAPFLLHGESSWYKNYTGSSEPSVEMTEGLVKKWRDSFNERKEFRMIVIKKDGGQCLGQVSVHNVDWDAFEGEYGAWLRISAQGQGLVSEIFTAFKSFGFIQLGLKRIIVLASQDALVSIKMAEKFGFKLEANGDWVLKWGNEPNLNGRRYVLKAEDC